ncbi:MAG: TonB-dependent receptor, plug [Cytophagaceae bacterium]|nr:TonB-dependent receptor, plug [Cytophagaceae bacterium]
MWFAILLCETSLLAQDSGGFSIQGKISDTEGVPLAYAHVVIEGLFTYHTETDSTGSYVLENIPEGTHQLIVQSIGHVTQTRTISGTKGEVINQHFSLLEDNQAMDDVVIVGNTEKEKLEHTAQAVQVIDLKENKLQSADLGDVLSLSQGVSVRRSGGLGSSARFSLNGLSGDQIRFFLDGIPLEYSGYTFGIATVPVNLVDRVEIYKGVVPIQFGADALGGAVNIVSPKVRKGLSGAISYQTGSFGTHRVAMDGKYLADSSGLFVSAGGFYDVAKNNYKVNVQQANDKGKLQAVTIKRFHDAYQAKGMNITLGVKNKSWADELSIKGFYSDNSKEVQHQALSMEGIPYGDVMTLRQSAGVNVIYRNDFSEKVAADIVAGYNYSQREFIDTSHCVYDWYGNCIYVKINPGESVGNVASSRASHQYTWDQNFYTRVSGKWEMAKNHTLRVTLAPTYTYRTGKEEFTNTYDPAAARGKMLNWVNGMEYEMNAFSNRLENILFVKSYLQKFSLAEPMPNLSAPLVTQRQESYFGFGNGLRYELSHRISAKASYEYAIRMPRPDELFGDGLFTANNLELEPERSHNINLQVTYKNNSHSKCKWFIQPNFFLRKINNLIFLSLGATDQGNVYKNMLEAVSAGGELTTGWTSPEDRLQLTFNTTYQNYYNNSQGGDFGSFYQDRIPNTPYLFANSSASYAFRNLLKKNDQLSPFWNMRYIHEFYIGWESAGLKSSKSIVPNQQIHTAGITYRFLYKKIQWAFTGEVQNLFDTKVYDFYRVQKPGRGYYAKLTLQL